MVLLLSDLLLPALQAAAYAALGLSIRIHAALRSLIALSAIATARLAAAAPALRPLLSALFALPPGEHLGSRPRPPTVLGVAVAEQLQEDQWPAAMEALGRLLGWAHDRGFRLVFIYEPGGLLKQGLHLHQLELQLLQRRLRSTVQLQAGWHMPPGPAGMGEASAAGLGALDAGYGCDMRVVLLAAADGEWPVLAAAAAAEPVAHEALPRAPLHHQPANATAGCSGSKLDEAIAAPARARRRLAAVAGPLASAEPDFVLVTGPALALAGFPAWAVRASEMYSIGPLARLRGVAELEGALRRFCGTMQRWGK